MSGERPRDSSKHTNPDNNGGVSVCGNDTCSTHGASSSCPSLSCGSMMAVEGWGGGEGNSQDSQGGSDPSSEEWTTSDNSSESSSNNSDGTSSSSQESSTNYDDGLPPEPDDVDCPPAIVDLTGLCGLGTSLTLHLPHGFDWYK